MAETVLSGVSSASVPKIWPHVEKFIKKACEYSRGQITPAAVYAELLQGDAQLWVASSEQRGIESGVITKITDNTLRRICTIEALGGNSHQRWMSHLHTIEEWASAQGCNAVQVNGRRGWAKMLRDYKLTSITLEKELGNE